jgi:hypothetical protein
MRAAAALPIWKIEAGSSIRSLESVDGIALLVPVLFPAGLCE